MSDYYTQFSEIIALDTQEQVDWVRVQLNSDRLEQLRSLSQNPPDKLPDWKNDLVLAQHIFSGEDGEFQWEIVPAGTPGKFDLSLYSEENCDLDAVAIFVQAFLKKFHPDHCFTMAWSFTCSKMRSGDFGGGAVFVTADKMEYMDTHSWLAKKARRAGPQANTKSE